MRQRSPIVVALFLVTCGGAAQPAASSPTPLATLAASPATAAAAASPIPSFLTAGQGFYILPKVPVQLINAGEAIARTLVYSISPEGATFSTELPQSP